MYLYTGFGHHYEEESREGLGVTIHRYVASFFTL